MPETPRMFSMACFRDSLTVTEPQQYAQMTTEIATGTGRHSRRMFDDESRQKWRRQLTERSDAGLAEVLRKFAQVATITVDCCFFKSTFTSQILSKTRGCGFEWKRAAVAIAPRVPLAGQPKHLQYCALIEYPMLAQ